jgi:nucleotide-binding universal stress UspA family protein
LDGSELADCVLPHTVAIAQAAEAKVVFLHVLETDTDHPHNPLDWQLRKVEAQTHLQEVEANWQQRGIPSESVLLEGKAADLLLAHVVTPPEMMRRIPLASDDARLVEEIVVRNQEKARYYFDEIRNRLPVEVETHLICDEDVTIALHNLVKKAEVDLVILSAHGGSAEAHRPYGSIVSNFIDYGATPLLIFQDLSPAEIELTEAEVVIQEINEGLRPPTGPLQSRTLIRSAA